MGMKVDDIEVAVDFYSRLFGAKPSLVRPDYAKWMLDDPLLNFSVDLHGEGTPGSAHFGIQVASQEELEQMRTWLDAVGLSRTDQNDLVCGYQLQHKSWGAERQCACSGPTRPGSPSRVSVVPPRPG